MTQRLVTLPYLTQRLQRPLRHLECAVADLKIEPVLVLNELTYYAAEIEDKIAERVLTPSAIRHCPGRGGPPRHSPSEMRSFDHVESYRHPPTVRQGRCHV